MERSEGRIIGGALLVGGGILLLLQNLGLFGGGGLLWALIFAVGGLAFLALYARDRANWWAFLPASVLLGLAIPIVLSAAGGGLESLGGTGFLATIGLGFVAVYATDRLARWWALIPGGTLVTLGVVAGLDVVGTAELAGAVFFLGLALTFLAVALLPHGEKRRDWAFFPALACLGLGMMVIATTTAAFTIVAAVALIASGVYLLYRTRRVERW